MYFVVKDGLNYSDTQMQNLVCGGQYCNSDSISTQIFTASKQPNRYVVKESSTSEQYKVPFLLYLSFKFDFFFFFLELI